MLCEHIQSLQQEYAKNKDILYACRDPLRCHKCEYDFIPEVNT